MMKIKHELSLARNIKVKICGGDDLLIEFFCEEVNEIKLVTKRIQKKFYEATGSTMSGGGGKTVEEMLKNLAIAKEKEGKSLVLEEY